MNLSELPYFSLLENFAFLAMTSALLFLYVSRSRYLGASSGRSVFFGIVLGLVSVVVVKLPIAGPLGASFDTRAAPVVLAGYYGGPVGGLIAAVIGAVARYNVGGPAAIGGMVSFFIYAAVGCAWSRYVRSRDNGRLNVLQLVALALVATVSVLPSFFIGQPFERGLTILQMFWPVLLLGNLTGTLCLGLMLDHAFQVVRDRDRHRFSVESFGIAQDAARIGVWSYDFRSGELSWDAMTHLVMGYARETFKPTLRGFLRMVLEEDRAAVEKAFEDCRRASSRFDMEFRIRDENGEIRYIRGQSNFVGTRPGDPDLVIGVAIDRTAEKKLQDDLALKSLAVENAVCGIMITEADEAMRIVSVNRAFTELTGYTAQDVVGRNCRFANEDPSTQKELDILLQAITNGERCTVRLRNRRKNGELFWNNIHLAPIKDESGVVTHFIGIQEDVTEQVEARIAAESARDELKAVVTTVADAILTVDHEHRISSANEAAEKIFGWSRNALVGQHIEMLIPQSFHAKHKLLAEKYINDETIAPGPMSMLRVVDARRRDGSVFPAMISLGRFVHQDKPAVAVTAHDMTEIVSANNSLTELSRRLREELNRAEEANTAKNRFLAHMSHELRTPLNAIIGFSDLIRNSESLASRPEKVREYAGDIHTSGAHLLSLINDILDISRIENDAFPIAIAPLEPGGAVASAVEALKPIAAKKDIEIVVEDQSDGPVAADSRALYQCLLNIVSNAVKFSADGADVHVRVSGSADRIEFRVADQGIGMSEETVSSIGDAFLRSADPNVAGLEGTGLGLAITKQLVEKQHGHLAIDSVLSRGTIVTMSLPRAKAPADTRRSGNVIDLPARTASGD